MSVRILEDSDGYKALYCSTTMIAFGDIFYDDEDPEEFLIWLGKDARDFGQSELSNKINEWRVENDTIGDN